MPLTACSVKEFLFESKLNGCFGVLLLHVDLEIFIVEVKLSELFSSSMNNQDFSAEILYVCYYVLI